MLPSDPLTIVRAHYDALTAHDLDVGSALIAPTFTWVVIPFDQILHGPTGYRQFLAGWLVAAPHARAEVQRMIVAGAIVTAEYIFRGRQTGVLQGPAGAIPPTGELMSVPVCDIFEIADGQIVHLHSYFDVATLLRQLGIPLLPGG